MEFTSLEEALRELVQAEGPKVLRDPARLRTLLQARVGRSQDEAIDTLVAVLKTPTGQQIVSSALDPGQDRSSWATELKNAGNFSGEDSEWAASALAKALTAPSEVQVQPGNALVVGDSPNPVAAEPAETIAIVQIAFSANGRLCALGDSAMHIALVDDSTQKWKIDVTSSTRKALSLQRIRRMAFDPSGSMLVIANSDRLAAFDVSSGAEIWSYSPPNLFSFLIQGPSDFAILSDSQLLVPFDEGSLNIWNINGWSERRKRMSVAPRMIAMLPDRESFVGSDGSQTFLWEVQGFARKHKITLERVYSLVAHAVQPVVGMRTLDQFHIFDAPNKRILTTIDVDPGLPLLAASPSAELFAVGGECGAMLVNFCGEPVGSVKTHSGSRLTALAFHPSGRTVALGGIDGEVTYVEVSPAPAGKRYRA